MAESTNDINMKVDQIHKAKAVCEPIKSEVLRSIQGKEVRDLIPIPANDFREACTYIGNEILNERLLKRCLSFLIANRTKLKLEFPNKFVCLPMVMPTTPMNLEYDDAMIAKDAYFYTLLKSPQNNLTYGYSVSPAYIFELIPEELRNCGFEIHYENGNDPLITDSDFKKIYDSFIESFYKVRRFFGLADLRVPKWPMPPA